MAHSPKVILLGFNLCGGTWLREVFATAGLNFRYDQTGELAADLKYCELSGKRPFAKWANLDGIGGLTRWSKRDLPFIEGVRSFKYLHACFPDARFILNTRDPYEWIAERYYYREGKYRDAMAWHHKCRETDLPALWLKEYEDHTNTVLTHFKGVPNFLHFDISNDSDARLIHWAGDLLPDNPALPQQRTGPEEDTVQALTALTQQLKAPRTKPPRLTLDQVFVDRLIAHSLGPEPSAEIRLNDSGLSKHAAYWKERNTVLRTDGAELPLIWDNTDQVFGNSHDQQLVRVQGVLNEMSSLGLSPPALIDMLDARRMGTNGSPAPCTPTLVYNRRPNVPNLILWPLPGYHTLAPTGSPGGYPVDTLQFDDKQDICVWRGNLTGRPMKHLLPKGADRRLIRWQLIELSKNPSPQEEREIEQLLNATTRYKIVKYFGETPGFDLGLTLSYQHRKLETHPLLAPYCKQRVPQTWFHNAKYVLSLSGNDTGSNFLPAISSNSLVLKETDGWELFYTDAFRPWEHFVPLSPGGSDLEEKLDWARTNPLRCNEMISAARAVFEKLSNPHNRKAWLTGLWGEVQGRFP